MRFLKDLKDSLQSVRRVHLYQIVERLKDRYSVSSLYVYFGFPSFSYCFWLSKGRPVYKRFDANLAPKITAIFHDTQKGCRFIFYQPGRQYQLSPNPKTSLALYAYSWSPVPYFGRRSINTAPARNER
mgnify:CR=1 FL=1